MSRNPIRKSFAQGMLAGKPKVPDLTLPDLRERDDPETLAPLLQALHDPIPAARCKAIRALQDVGGARAVEPLLSLLADPEVPVRLNAARTLGHLRDPRAVEPLIATLNDESELVRTQAIWALNKLGDARAIAPLLARIEGETCQVRCAAIEALGALGDIRVVGPLLTVLLSPCTSPGNNLDETLVRRSALQALTLLPRGILLSENVTAEARCRALESLRQVPLQRGDHAYYTPFRSTQALCQQSLDDPNTAVRRNAQAVLDYLTLARPSEKQREEAATLLHPLQSTVSPTDQQRLLRSAEKEA